MTGYVYRELDHFYWKIVPLYKTLQNNNANIGVFAIPLNRDRMLWYYLIEWNKGCCSINQSLHFNNSLTSIRYDTEVHSDICSRRKKIDKYYSAGRWQ